MINISNLRYNKLYKKQSVRFLPVTRDKNKNSAIFLMTDTVEDSISFLNNTNFNLLYYKSYYTPYKEKLKLTITEKQHMFNQTLIYDRINTECPRIREMKRDVKVYQDKNLVYDLHTINALFLEQNTLPPRRKARQYVEIITKMINHSNMNSYTEKIIYIPFKKSTFSSMKDFQNPMSVESFLQALGYIAHSEPEMLDSLKGVTFVIHEPVNNIFFKFNTDALTSRLATYLGKILITLSKVVSNTPLNSEENSFFTNGSEDASPEEVKEVKKDILCDRFSDFLIERFQTSNVKGMTGDTKLTEKAKEVIKEVADSKNIETSSELAKELETNEELIRIAKEISNENLTKKKSLAMSKRDELIRDEHGKVLVDGKKSLSEVLSEHTERSIEKSNIDVPLIYDDLKQSTNKDFEINYNKKQYLKDQTMVLDSFSKGDREIHMFIRKIEREDSSDSFTKKETLTVYFEDENRVKHTFKVDIPKIVDDKYLFINGNKKGFVKQLVLKPVVKTAPDAVQLVTNYNKVFLYRRGDKSSPKIEKIKKTVSSLIHREYDIKKADSSLVNKEYLTNIEYDEFAKDIFYICIKDLLLCFNQVDIRKKLAEVNFDTNTLPVNHLPIGIKNKKPVLLDVQSNKVIGTDLSLTDYIVDCIKEIKPDIDEEIAKISVGKRYMYTEASVLNQKVPLILFLAYKEGLSSVLKKSKMKYYFTDKRPSLTADEKTNKGVIQFADGYLVYDLYPMRNSLLMNAFTSIPTREYEIELFDTREVYLDIFNTLFGSRTIGKGLDNIYQLFFDPITLEVLKDLGLPTDFVEIFLYGNSLLEDNMYVNENDMSLYRVRSTELINAYLYRVLADAYRVYKDSKNASTPIKVSVPQDKLMKELLASLNTEDVNILNPVIAATNNCTYKGLSGLNLQTAYNLDKRAYSKSMTGLLGISSPYNASVKYLPII